MIDHTLYDKFCPIGIFVVFDIINKGIMSYNIY